MRFWSPLIFSWSCIFWATGCIGSILQHRILYAVVALLLIAGQAVVLDALTTLLFRFLRRRWR